MTYRAYPTETCPMSRALRRAANGYIVREEFYDEWSWHMYLKRAMSRRRDYRPLEEVVREMTEEPK